MISTATATTTTLATNSANPAYGQALTFTATVSAATPNLPVSTGSVQFRIDGADYGQAVVLVNGAATLSSLTSLSAGNHTVTAVYSGDPTFASSTATGLTQTVSKAHLTVRADGKDRLYGQGNPPLTYTLGGFVNGEDAAIAGITGVPTLATGATAASPVGSYAITAGVGTLAAANYDFTAVDGVLTIHQADAILSLSGLSFTYDGTPHAATATTDPAGLGGVAITYDGSPTPPTGAGTYTVVATVTDPNYRANPATGLLTIAKATPTISWANPAAIVQGTPLGAAQLNAIASVPESFVYTPAAGTTLGVGPGQVLMVAFTPADPANSQTTIGSVRIDIVPVAPPTDTTPPTVISLVTTRWRGALGHIVLQFTKPMVPTGAASLGAYRLVSAGRDRRFGTRDDRALALRSAAYDPATRSVTLVPKRRVALNQPLQLIARGSAGLVDLALNALDGDRDGRPGGDYVGQFGTRPRAAILARSVPLGLGARSRRAPRR